MSERTIEVTKISVGIILTDSGGESVYLPEDEIDAIMEDIKNLR